MKSDILERFMVWSKAVHISPRAVDMLLKYMHEKKEHADATEWIDSPERIMTRNYPCDIEILDSAPNQRGYLLIGHCPNGDAVFIEAESERLRVSYGEYGNLYSGNLKEGMRHISDSLDEYVTGLADGTLPRDFWDQSE